MEHANASTSLRQQLQQQQQQQQHQQLQQHNQQQQQQNENQQQFCLRWHNHQTSLLSTLPILLDQSHLTDVTLSAEGRTLRAHRVVLSACSTFFLELFRALDTTNHPVIIIPGASFAAIVALLTFMYSGEVNVYEEQIPTLLSLAETLGIKGLADVQNNKTTKRQPDFAEHQQQPKIDVDTPPTPPSPRDFMAQQHHMTTLLPPPLIAMPTTTAASKIPTPLESLFLKSLQFYPNLLPQPLNFSQTALNKTTELLAKYQQHCNLYQSAFSGGISPMQQHLEEVAALSNEDAYSTKRLSTGEKKQQQYQMHQHQQHPQQHKDIKRIDKIVESLRCSNKTQSNDNFVPTAQNLHQQQQLQPHLTLKSSAGSFAQSMSPNLSTKPPMFASATSQQQQEQSSPQHGYMSPEDHNKLQHQLDHFAGCSHDANPNRGTPDGTLHKSETSLVPMPEKHSTPTPASPQPKTPSNSKLYATCFICHKQLSNQYNLRVHLETHQNVRYACNVCSHVSRSKDALRKHVSYRHPGAPSPCESEARRKRAKTINIATSTTSTIIGTPPSPTSAPTTPFQLSGLSGVATNTSSSGDAAAAADTTTMTPTPTPLSSAYMFLPNQFHLAAAATAAATTLQQQQQMQPQSALNNNSGKNNNQNNTTTATTVSTATTSLTKCNLKTTNSEAINTTTVTTSTASTISMPANDVNNMNASSCVVSSNISVKSEQGSAAESNSSTNIASATTTPTIVGVTGGSLSAP